MLYAKGKEAEGWGKTEPDGKEIEDKQLSAREQEAVKTEHNLFLGRLGDRAAIIAKDATHRALSQLLGDKFTKMSAESQEEYEADVKARFNALLLKDNDFQGAMSALIQARDIEGATKHYKSILKQHMTQAARDIIRKYRGFDGSLAAEPKAEDKAQSKDQLLSKPPRPDEVDHAAMKATYGNAEAWQMVRSGRVLLKGKKGVFRLPGN
jgi:hypothetical protein